MIEYISGIIDAIQGIKDDDVTISDLLMFVYNVLFKVIFAFIKHIFSQSRDFFISLGDDISNVFGLPSLSEHWFMWLIGIFITIFIVKYVITATIELISKFLDIT